MPHRFTSDPDEVSARMKRIRGKGTKPEVALFTILSRGGFSFTPHERIAGVSVDAVLDERVVLFVDSPFWHLRDARLLDRLSPYWQMRLRRNRRRDRRQTRGLRAAGFTVVRLWADEVEEQRGDPTSAPGSR